MAKEKPTLAEQDRAQKNRHSIMTNLRRLDVYSKFKIIAEIQGRKIVSALREAITDYINKYKEVK